jgi:RecB family exonuclease
VTGDPTPSPKVTPYLLNRVDDLCARRLDEEYRGQFGAQDPVNRGRVRESFLEAARTAHTLPGPLESAPWTPDPTLEPEELAVFQQAVHWYMHLFAGRAVELYLHDLERPSEVDGLDVRIGGWVDLTVVGEGGMKELRQLDFWVGAIPQDPLDDWKVKLALLRLDDWLGDDPARVSWTDLLHGVRKERVVDAAARGVLRDEVAQRIDHLVDRTKPPRPEPGANCPQCNHRKGCPEFPHAKKVALQRRGDTVPGVLSLTPSSLEAFERCPRLWRSQHLLWVPPSDGSTPGVHGQQVHDLLRQLHRGGPCDDPARIEDVVQAHGASERVHAELSSHARRCPAGATSFGHEFTPSRLYNRPPHFIASARIDAAWVHDGLLDARDYKTGAVWHSRVADDARARLQAWVLAPIAERHGLRLRVRYEHLATEVDEDPDDWEPDADDLDAVEQELIALVARIRAETEWRGVADADICRWCRYRSICPDSAVRGPAAWPRVDDDTGLDETAP